MRASPLSSPNTQKGSSQRVLIAINDLARHCKQDPGVRFTLDKTYRVELNTHYVKVLSFGMDPLALSVEGDYASVEDLPQWMQDKLDVLSILHVPPPVTDVPGVGRRMGEDLYWVYHDE